MVPPLRILADAVDVGFRRAAVTYNQHMLLVKAPLSDCPKDTAKAKAEPCSENKVQHCKSYKESARNIILMDCIENSCKDEEA